MYFLIYYCEYVKMFDYIISIQKFMESKKLTEEDNKVIEKNCDNGEESEK